MIGSQPLESGQEYVYLGQLLTGDLIPDKEISGIRVGWSAYSTQLLLDHDRQLTAVLEHTS